MIRLDNLIYRLAKQKALPLLAILVFMFVSGLVFAFLTVQTTVPTVQDLRKEIYRNGF
ncbi:MAG: hypothetical protein ACMG6E_03055 [Candidatus Roizmanbacteria bacterium]